MNPGKHHKSPLEELEYADFDPVPTRGRSSRLLGSYIKSRRARVRTRLSPAGTAPENAAQETPPEPVLVRLEGLEATPENLDRIRRRVIELNRQLEEANTPFRIRMA